MICPYENVTRLATTTPRLVYEAQNASCHNMPKENSTSPFWPFYLIGIGTTGTAATCGAHSTESRTLTQVHSLPVIFASAQHTYVGR